MNCPLTELLRANPNCRVTIITSTRKKYFIGDTRTIRGKQYVKRQQFSHGYGLVRRGKPLTQWIRVKESK